MPSERRRFPVSYVLFPAVFRGFSFSVHFSRIIARTSAPHCPVSASFASGFVLRLLAPHCMRVFFLGSYAGFNPASCSIWVVYLRWLLFDPCGFAAWSALIEPRMFLLCLLAPHPMRVYLSTINYQLSTINCARACACARSLYYIYARTRTRAFLCFIAYFALLPQNTPKNSDFVTCLFSVLYKESAFFLAFFCKNIWSYQKKAVPLHSLLRNK